MSETGRIRFGLFDFNPATGELRREGAPVRLQSQPAQVLGLLLATPGEVVARESLRQAVWGSETFVDFDRGLNFCVAQIRSALGDSAESPRFVRTLPKRGYQFIAPVTPASTGVEPPAKPISSRRFGTIRATIAAVLLFTAAGGLALVLRRSSAHPPIRIAVARFDNETGAPDFDQFADGLTDSVVAEMATSSQDRYAVIGNAAILRRPRDQRDLIAISSSLKVGYVVLGQVQRDGARIRILAHLIRLPDQSHIWVTRLERTVDESLSAQSEIAHKIVTDFSRRLAAVSN